MIDIKKTSIINVVVIFVYIIQIKQKEKKHVIMLFIDIKGVFNYLLNMQLITPIVELRID